MLEKLLSLISVPVYAADNAAPPQIGDLFNSVDRIVSLIFPVGAVICIAFMIYGGYMWIISGGDPSKKQLAQGTLTWAIIGFVFLFLIKAILTVVVNTIS